MTKIIITGGCGFIGHHFVEHIYKNTDWQIIVLDKLTYASMGYERLRDTDTLDTPRVRVFCYDLVQPITEGLMKEIGMDIDYIVHMAAETHVDNSISDPVPFIKNNVMSTVQLLEFARKLPSLKIFFYFSTDEVFGPALGDTLYKENDRHNPTNPYSASKSAAEQICVSYHNTYKIPLMRINVMNAFGERQHVEKFIPKVIYNLLNGKKTYIHSYPDGKTSGSRFYVHCRNIADAVLFLLQNGSIGESYNVSGEKEVTNLDIALQIASFANIPLDYELVNFHQDRPGHDLRYGLDDSKIRNLGWKPPLSFDDSLRKVVLWTLKYSSWLEK